MGNIIEEEEPAAKKLKSTMNQVQCKDRVIFRSTRVISGRSRSLSSSRSVNPCFEVHVGTLWWVRVEDL